MMERGNLPPIHEEAHGSPSGTERSTPAKGIRLPAIAVASYVMPLVDLVVEVRGTVTARDAKVLAVTWKTTVAETAEMAHASFPSEPIEDAYQRFLQSVPASVADSFDGKL